MARRVFYGWYVVAGLGVTTIVSYGITQYLFGVLVVPIQRDTGWSRAEISVAYSLGWVVFGLLGVPVGRLLDRYGARLPMTAGSLLGAICLAGLSRISQPWQLYLLWAGGLGLAMALTLYNVSFTVVANFFHRRRGAALALLTLIGGLASPIYIPLAGWLVDRLGWREALVVLAATVVLVALPIHALVIRRRPEDIGLAPDGASTAAEPHGAYLREALAGRVFWLLTLAALATALAYGLVLEHGVAMLIARGYSDVAAASLIGLTGVASLPGRLVFNLLSDRLGPQGLLALCTAAQGAGVLLLLASPAPFVFGFVAVYGLAFGAISPLRASVMAEHFGRVAYGSITGVQNLVTAVSSAAGALLGGYLFDAFGNYELAIAVTGASFLVGGLFVSMTPQPASNRDLRP